MYIKNTLKELRCLTKINQSSLRPRSDWHWFIRNKDEESGQRERYPEKRLPYPVVMRAHVGGEGHLKGLDVSVGKKTSLSTQRLLGTGKRQTRRSDATGASMKWFCSLSQESTHRLPFQVVVHFLHVCVCVSVNRSPVDVVAKTAVR